MGCSNRKRNWGCWLGLVVAILLLAGFSWLVYASWPVYPAFLKSVDSYEEMAEALRETPNIVIPADTDDFLSLEVRMNHRTRSAIPCGYMLERSVLIEGQEICIGVVCEPAGTNLFEPKIQYRNFWMDVIHNEAETENAACMDEYVFSADSYTYYVQAIYEDNSDDSVDFKVSIQDRLLMECEGLIDSFIKTVEDKPA